MGEIPVTPTEWNQLVTQSEINTIFQTYEWFESWWKVVGTHSQLYLISILQEQRVVGIAPLMISGRVFRRLKFVGDGKSDYCDFIIGGREKCAILAAMWKQIASDSHLWDSIVLSNIPEESSTCDVLEEVCGARRMWIVSSVMHITGELSD